MILNRNTAKILVSYPPFKGRLCLIAVHLKAISHIWHKQNAWLFIDSIQAYFRNQKSINDSQLHITDHPCVLWISQHKHTHGYKVNFIWLTTIPFIWRGKTTKCKGKNIDFKIKLISIKLCNMLLKLFQMQQSGRPIKCQPINISSRER